MLFSRKIVIRKHPRKRWCGKAERGVAEKEEQSIPAPRGLVSDP